MGSRAAGGTAGLPVHDTETSNIGLAFKIAGFLFKGGAGVTFNHERGVAWDKIVQGFIAKYKELCSRYNAGLVTKAEYEARLREMEALHREAAILDPLPCRQFRIWKLWLHRTITFSGRRHLKLSLRLEVENESYNDTLHRIAGQATLLVV